MAAGQQRVSRPANSNRQTSRSPIAPDVKNHAHWRGAVWRLLTIGLLFPTPLSGSTVTMLPNHVSVKTPIHYRRF